MRKDFNKYISKEDIWIAIKDMKNFQDDVIRKIQIPLHT